jgi:hypothetical protein
MMRPGTGGLLIGPATRRAVTDLVSRTVARGAVPHSADRRNRKVEEAATAAAGTRRFRTARTYSGTTDGPIVVPARELPARRGDHQEAIAGPSVAPAVSGRRTTTGDRFLPRSKPLGITTITTTTVPAGSNGSRAADKDRRIKTPVAAPERRTQKAFRPALSGHYRPPKYEAQDHNRSASLRDGPSKAPRVHRRPKPKTNTIAPPRLYRDYTKVVKDGATLRVPAGR